MLISDLGFEISDLKWGVCFSRLRLINVPGRSLSFVRDDMRARFDGVARTPHSLREFLGSGDRQQRLRALVEAVFFDSSAEGLVAHVEFGGGFSAVPLVAFERGEDAIGLGLLFR